MGNYYEHSFMLYNSILEDMRYLANMPLNCILNAKERTYSDPQSYFHSFYRYISGNNRHDTIIFLEELNINLSVFNVGPYKNMLNVGQIINESSFSQEAIEGLKNISSPKKLDKMVKQLNQSLHAQLSKTKDRRHKRGVPNLYWAVFAIIMILTLCFLAYWLIYLKYH